MSFERKDERQPSKKFKIRETTLAFVKETTRTVVRFSEDNNLFGMAKSTLEDSIVFSFASSFTTTIPTGVVVVVRSSSSSFSSLFKEATVKFRLVV